jgi:RimJ/RimL family protein N-acetyltransferase
VLRPAQPGDLDALHRLWTSPSVREFLFDGRTLAADDVRGFIERSDQSFRERGYGLWLGFGRCGRALDTFGALVPRDEPGAAPSLLYGVRAEASARGLATETASAVLAHAFGALGLPRVHADVDAPNVASVRVLEKLGMVRVGERAGAFGALLDFELDAAAFAAAGREVR